MARDYGPTFQIVFLFHQDLSLLRRTMPRCLSALTGNTSETFEVVLHCDGTPPEIAAQLPSLLPEWGIDELRIRRRTGVLAAGDPSNNGHQRFFATAAKYLIAIEDDVVMYRTSGIFDVLRECRELFESHPDVLAIGKVDDYACWSWKLEDLGPPIEPGVRSVNRISTHFLGYDVQRFNWTAGRFGAFMPDVFIDRSDLSYNWEDLVSHVGATGNRRLAFPEGWPLHVFHCDEKVAPDSMYHTQKPAVKARILDELESRFATG
ncbi:hypothetical protein [Actinomadura sp. 6N118]|uniref:hypothetical protein n=1 Tax=Actinomadura sp. 6N118 TaxID=3375151 RepID=UPI0037A170B2